MCVNFLSVATNLMRENIYYALGRFYFVRKCYSAYRRSIIRLFKTEIKAGFSSTKNTLFPEISIGDSVNSLKKSAVAFGFNLPKNTIQEIHKFAMTEKCFRSGDCTEFLYDEVKSGKLPDDNPVVLGFVKDLTHCNAINHLSVDPVLRAVCTQYLGYRPTKMEIRLFWSFVTNELDVIRRKKWQTTRYHFDADGFNFIYVNFYITPVTKLSGAHVMMKYSHNRKPLRMLFHSAIQTDEAILNYFGCDNEIIIEGPAGFGFAQDSSCYHKALTPVAHNRLMLQFRIR